MWRARRHRSRVGFRRRTAGMAEPEMRSTAAATKASSTGRGLRCRRDEGGWRQAGDDRRRSRGSLRRGAERGHEHDDRQGQGPDQETPPRTDRDRSATSRPYPSSRLGKGRAALRARLRCSGRRDVRPQHHAGPGHQAGGLVGARPRRGGVGPSPVTARTRPPAVTRSPPGPQPRRRRRPSHRHRPGGVEAVDHVAARGAAGSPRRAHHGDGDVGDERWGGRATSRRPPRPGEPRGRRSSRGSTTWVSGSPKRTLYSSTLGPSAVSISPAYEHAAVVDAAADAARRAWARTTVATRRSASAPSTSGTGE